MDERHALGKDSRPEPCFSCADDFDAVSGLKQTLRRPIHRHGCIAVLYEKRMLVAAHIGDGGLEIDRETLACLGRRESMDCAHGSQLLRHGLCERQPRACRNRSEHGKSSPHEESASNCSAQSGTLSVGHAHPSPVCCPLVPCARPLWQGRDSLFNSNGMNSFSLFILLLKKSDLIALL